MTADHDGLRANYAGAFDGRLTLGRSPALLIVDFVMAYLDPASPLYAAAEDALSSNERLLAAARRTGIPVIFTNVVYSADGIDGGLFYQKVPALRVLQSGNPLAEFSPSLKPLPNELVFTKKYASAFFGTSLTTTLTANRIDTLLITGLSTSGCVRASALDALQKGFQPFVVRDACADRHAAPHEASLFDLDAKYAEVIDEARAIELLSDRAPR